MRQPLPFVGNTIAHRAQFSIQYAAAILRRDLFAARRVVTARKIGCFAARDLQTRSDNVFLPRSIRRRCFFARVIHRVDLRAAYPGGRKNFRLAFQAYFLLCGGAKRMRQYIVCMHDTVARAVPFAARGIGIGSPNKIVARSAVHKKNGRKRAVCLPQTVCLCRGYLLFRYRTHVRRAIL